MSADRQLGPEQVPVPLHVLLIEDSAEDALLLQRYLRKAGFDVHLTRVETAAAMKEFLETDGESLQVILADYNLPAFSAPEALRILKNTRFDIPFIMMSGVVSEDTAVAAMRAGAHDYVSKQNLARLVPAIERELAEVRARRERRKTELALRSAERRFHRLVAGMPIGLLISRKDGKIIYANDAVSRLLGYTCAELISGEISLDDICRAHDGHPFSRAYQWKDDRAEPIELECLDRQNSRIPVLVGAAILNPEAPEWEREIAAFFADLTEQKRGEEVLRRTEKLAAAGRLATSIAHEINNPLESVTNCLYLLEQAKLDPESRRYLKLAQQELNRVSHIATQTLRFYRQHTRPVPTDIHDLFETVLALYEGRMRSFKVETERQYGNISRVMAFDGAVRQVIANLVANAVDAMQTNGGRLIFRTRSSRNWRDQSEGISITVADTGSGMTRETQARLFEPFFSTKGITGTGLGLWVSRDIVVKHRGSIRVRSRQGFQSGTVFRIFLPKQSPEALEKESVFLRATA